MQYFNQYRVAELFKNEKIAVTGIVRVNITYNNPLRKTSKVRGDNMILSLMFHLRSVTLDGKATNY